MLGVVVLAFLPSFACSVKKTVRVPVSPRILNARTASFEDVVSLLRRQSEQIRSLSSTSIRISLTSGRAESGELQEYRSAPGYVLLRRPSAIRLNVQNPVSKTSIADLASQGDEFSLWIPRDNKFYTGLNSTQEFDLDQKGAALTARPLHILEALLPPEVPSQETGLRLAMEEERDAEAKYYVLTVYQEVSRLRLRTVRKIWLERSEMAVVREQEYDEEGGVVSVVRYAEMAEFGGMKLPLHVHMERPVDGYSLEMSFKDWRLNPELPDAAFILQPPPGAEQVPLKEKPRSEEH